MGRNLGIAILICASCMQLGCQTFQNLRQRLPSPRERINLRASEPSPLPPEANIYVGGMVEHPQSLQIPASGISLLQAVTLGSLKTDKDQGGISIFAQAADRVPIFVSLQRNSSNGQQTYYIPLSLVQFDIAGALPLQAGDVIQIVPYASTSLANTAPQGQNAEFSVTGMIEKPGRYLVNDAEGTQRSILDVQGDLAGKQSPNSTLITLARRSESGLAFELYLISISDPSNKLLLKSKLEDGDVINYTRLPLVPIILQGYLENLKTAAKAQAERARENFPGPPDRTRLLGGVTADQAAGTSTLGRLFQRTPRR